MSRLATSVLVSSWWTISRWEFPLLLRAHQQKWCADTTWSSDGDPWICDPSDFRLFQVVGIVFHYSFLVQSLRQHQKGRLDRILLWGCAGFVDYSSAMSLRFLCEEITWSKQVFLPLNDLIKATLEKKRFPQPTRILDYPYSQVDKKRNR
jgi:hypothetical protein